jgi:CheY-like chemotaxis protein
VSELDQEDFPPIAVLIVDEHTSSARQLAKLLRLWGVASVATATTFDSAIIALEQQAAPTLVLLAQGPQSATNHAIAIWLAARPAMRRRTLVAVYTHMSQAEVKRELRRYLDVLAQEPQRVEQFFDRPTQDGGSAVRELVRQGGEAADIVYQRLYDVYLSKRLTIDGLRSELQSLAARVAQYA